MKGISNEEYAQRIPNPVTTSDVYSYNILEQLLLLSGQMNKIIALLEKDNTPANQAMVAELKVVEEGGSLDADMTVEKPKRTRKKKVVENDVQGD